MTAGAPRDATDDHIIEILRANGRATLAEIGQAVGLSAPAVKRRMEKLEHARVITGYTVLVDETKRGHTVEAFTELRFAGTTRVAEITRIAQSMSEVHALFTTAGDPDALVHLRVRDIEHLTRAIDRLRRSGHVVGTKTMMVLGAWTPGRRV